LFLVVGADREQVSKARASDQVEDLLLKLHVVEIVLGVLGTPDVLKLELLLNTLPSRLKSVD
jgi:hypothetical protein